MTTSADAVAPAPTTKAAAVVLPAAGALPLSAPAAVNAHWRLELTADQLGISEQAYDSDGDLVYGTAEDAYIRLRKRSNSKL